MKPLPDQLIEVIERRIADPARRHDDLGGIEGETLTSPEDVFALLERNNPELGPTPFRDCVDQMHEWGQAMPPMHVTRYENGSIRTSSVSEPGLPLARPATAQAIAEIENMIGRPPRGPARTAAPRAPEGAGRAIRAAR